MTVFHLLRHGEHGLLGRVLAGRMPGVGMTERGPIEGPPVLCTSFGQFQQQFGGYLQRQTDANGEHGLLPIAIEQFFDNGAAAFTSNDKRRKTDTDAKDKKIAALEEKLQRKQEVLSELMEEHVQLKKGLGEP